MVLVGDLSLQHLSWRSQTKKVGWWWWVTCHWQPSVPWLADQEGRMVWWVTSHWQPSVPWLADREGKT